MINNCTLCHLPVTVTCPRGNEEIPKGHYYGKLGSKNKANRSYLNTSEETFEKWPFPFTYDWNGPFKDGMKSIWLYPVRSLKTKQVFGTLIQLLGCPNEGWARNAYYGLIDILQHGTLDQIEDGLSHGGIHSFRTLFSNNPHQSMTWDGFAAGIDILERLIELDETSRRICVDALHGILGPLSWFYRNWDEEWVKFIPQECLHHNCANQKPRIKTFASKMIRNKTSYVQNPQITQKIFRGLSRYPFEPDMNKWLQRLEMLVGMNAGFDSHEHQYTIGHIKRWHPTYECVPKPLGHTPKKKASIRKSNRRKMHSSKSKDELKVISTQGLLTKAMNDKISQEETPANVETKLEFITLENLQSPANLTTEPTFQFASPKIEEPKDSVLSSSRNSSRGEKSKIDTALLNPLYTINALATVQSEKLQMSEEAVFDGTQIEADLQYESSPSQSSETKSGSDDEENSKNNDENDDNEDYSKSDEWARQRAASLVRSILAGITSHTPSVAVPHPPRRIQSSSGGSEIRASTTKDVSSTNELPVDENQWIGPGGTKVKKKKKITLDKDDQAMMEDVERQLVDEAGTLIVGEPDSCSIPLDVDVQVTHQPEQKKGEYQDSLSMVVQYSELMNLGSCIQSVKNPILHVEEDTTLGHTGPSSEMEIITPEYHFKMIVHDPATKDESTGLVRVQPTVTPKVTHMVTAWLPITKSKGGDDEEVVPNQPLMRVTSVRGSSKTTSAPVIRELKLNKTGSTQSVTIPSRNILSNNEAMETPTVESIRRVRSTSTERKLFSLATPEPMDSTQTPVNQLEMNIHEARVKHVIKPQDTLPQGAMMDRQSEENSIENDEELNEIIPHQQASKAVPKATARPININHTKSSPLDMGLDLQALILGELIRKNPQLPSTLVTQLFTQTPIQQTETIPSSDGPRPITSTELRNIFDLKDAQIQLHTGYQSDSVTNLLVTDIHSHRGSNDVSVGPNITGVAPTIRLHVNLKARASWDEEEIPYPVKIDTEVTTNIQERTDDNQPTGISFEELSKDSEQGLAV